jgi:hypothetical protein
MKEVEAQMIITQFINVWMVNRVPKLSQSFTVPTDANPDLVHKTIGNQKELEILEMIFDDN